MIQMSKAKIVIISLLSLGILCMSVEESFAKKKKRSRQKSTEALDGKSLFFGGVHLGLSMSQVDGDNFSGYNKLDANFSATAYIKLDKNIALSNEVGYNTKGSLATGRQLPWLDASGRIIESYSIKLGYAEFALLGNYFDKKRNNVGVGLAYGRLVSSEEKSNGQVISGFPFEKNTLDAVINGEVRLHPEWELFLNLRFQYSILPIRKDYTGNFGRSEQVNKQVLLRLGYLF